jgi:hypothetical protein
MKFLPRYLLIVFALAGDSTITRDFAILFYIPTKLTMPVAPQLFALNDSILREQNIKKKVHS